VLNSTEPVLFIPPLSQHFRPVFKKRGSDPELLCNNPTIPLLIVLSNFLENFVLKKLTVREKEVVCTIFVRFHVFPVDCDHYCQDRQ